METKGKWKVFERLDGTIAICVEKPPGYPRIATILANEEEDIANANLIAAAVNACKKVNPDNPMAVAEAIGGMREALKELNRWLYGANIPYSEEKVNLKRTVRQALAKYEGK